MLLYQKTEQKPKKNQCNPMQKNVKFLIFTKHLS